MAEDLTLCRPVQELAMDGNEVPEEYIQKGSNSAIDASVPLLDVPVIDLGLLVSSSPSGREELQKLKLALGSCGCFQLINHGMTSSFLDEMREVSKEFFALPLDEKHKYSRTADDIEGYGNDTVLSEHQTLDWTDRLYLTLSPKNLTNFKFWPENPQNFREILNEYTMKVEILCEVILKAMAISLNLKEDSFLNQYGERATMTARFNFYPPCPRPDLILGVKPHADGSVITFLLQDKEVEGLQVLKDDHWFRVPIISHALLVNTGDQAEIMSNGMLKSPVHRVVTNSEKQRITLAVFCIPQPDLEIGPVEELINDERPRLYKNVKNFVDLYFQYYQLDKRTIEAAKL